VGNYQYQSIMVEDLLTIISTILRIACFHDWRLIYIYLVTYWLPNSEQENKNTQLVTTVLPFD